MSKEIDRIKGFAAGNFQCECGENICLYWNGGELDSDECKCGRFYRTEHQEVDLVIYDSKPNDS